MSCYRPPNADAKQFFENLQLIVNRLDSGNTELFILGDLNCNMLPSHNNSPKNELNSLCELHQLDQLISTPTRITSNTRTLIDIILTNRPHRILSSGVIHLSISDHSVCYQKNICLI